ncbi:MAG: cobalamin biosynthetic protein CobC [Halocynthiibacter sp.]
MAQPAKSPRDHGGGLDAAIAEFGGARADWIDLSTGINPEPYPVGEISAQAWEVLPDQNAQRALVDAARQFWNVPDEAQIIPAHGASAIIARIPHLRPIGRVSIQTPTYNEHAAAFAAAGWEVLDHAATGIEAEVFVHPNNPDGRLANPQGAAPLTIIDESFCHVMPGQSLIAKSAAPGTIILKSFGKFWGLAGLRLGFAIAHPETLENGAASLNDLLGPWAASGPAIEIGTRALRDTIWADEARARLAIDAARLDALMAPHSALIGGTDLFRLYDVRDATAFQNRLAKAHIWSRIFPYSQSLIRLGLPKKSGWNQLETALL